ncbi:MAG: hypothetical protein RR256_01105 [Bacteroidales bacterium]
MKITLKSLVFILFFVSIASFASSQNDSSMPVQDTSEESFQSMGDTFEEWSNLYSEVLFRDANVSSITTGFRLSSDPENASVPVIKFTKDKLPTFWMQNLCATEMFYAVNSAKYQSHYYIYSIRCIRI